MDEVFVSIPLSEERSICISAITREMLDESGITELGDDYGFFVYETFPHQPQAGIEIIAKAASIDAAMKLAEILKAAATR